MKRLKKSKRISLKKHRTSPGQFLKKKKNRMKGGGDKKIKKDRRVTEKRGGILVRTDSCSFMAREDKSGEKKRGGGKDTNLRHSRH